MSEKTERVIRALECCWASPSITLPNVITTDHTITCELKAVE